MATGRLNAVDVPAATYTTLYAPPTYTNVQGDVGFPRYTVSGIVSLVNRTAAPINVRVAHVESNTTNPTPLNAEFIEYEFALGPGEVLERTGMVWVGANDTPMSPYLTGQQIVVYAAAVGVSAVAYGYEEII